MNQYDFILPLNSNNTEFIWLYVKTAINSALNLYVPKIPVKESNQLKWFNSTICHKIKCLCTAKRQFARHPTEGNRLKVDLQKDLQQKITDAKHGYESNLALNYAHTNSNKILSSIKGRENFPVKMYYIDKSASTDLDDFSSINISIQFFFIFRLTIICIRFTIKSDNSHVQDILFSDSDVLDELSSLDVTKACGIDNLSPKLILCRVITNNSVPRTCLLCSFIPLDRLTHCVIPVYKPGDKSSVSNYRPISLLCTLSKVLEKIVYNNIISRVKKQSTKHQFGFLPKRSTLQKLLVFAEKVIEPNRRSVRRPLTLFLITTNLTNYQLLE